jgi:hypothetical protein
MMPVNFAVFVPPFRLFEPGYEVPVESINVFDLIEVMNIGPVAEVNTKPPHSGLNVCDMLMAAGKKCFFAYVRKVTSSRIRSWTLFYDYLHRFLTSLRYGL